MMRLLITATATAFLIIGLASAALCATPAAGDSLENDAGAWLPVTFKLPVWRRWQAYFEIQPRWQRLSENHLTETLVRTGLGYEFKRRWSVFAGYYFSAHTSPEFSWENRLWQQISYSTKLGRTTVQSRFRCEESWRKQYEGVSVRVRDQIKVTYPLGRSNWYVALSEEPIVHVNSPENGPKAGFAQNRLFIGIGRSLNAFTRLEIGYLNQYRNSRTNRPDIVNHLLVSQLSFDFTHLKRGPQSKLARKQTVSPPGKTANQYVVSCAPQFVLLSLTRPVELLDIDMQEPPPSQLHPALHNLQMARSGRHL